MGNTGDYRDEDSRGMYRAGNSYPGMGIRSMGPDYDLAETVRLAVTILSLLGALLGWIFHADYKIHHALIGTIVGMAVGAVGGVFVGMAIWSLNLLIIKLWTFYRTASIIAAMLVTLGIFIFFWRLLMFRIFLDIAIIIAFALFNFIVFFLVMLFYPKTPDGETGLSALMIIVYGMFGIVVYKFDPLVIGYAKDDISLAICCFLGLIGGATMAAIIKFMRPLR